MKTEFTFPLFVSVIGAVATMALGGGSAACQVSGVTSAQTEPVQGDVDVSVFYDDLAPYGEWTELEGRGWCWVPAGVPVDWQPYTEGHWVWSDECGWTWVSDFDWGWAPFHYGRWGFEPEYGWVWFPGTVWGPAWVAWRSGPEYFGWAPLPPGVSFGFGAGLELGGRDLDDLIPAFGWCFVPCDRFLSPNVHDALVLHARNVTLLRETRLGEHIGVEHGRVFDHGVGLAEVERVTGRHVEHVAVRDAEEPRAGRVAEGEVTMFRPRIKESHELGRPAPAALARSRSVEPRSDADIERMRADEMKKLEGMHESRRQELERLHREEAPRAGEDEARLRERHEAETRALEEQHQRERRIVEHRFERMPRRGRGRG